MFVIFEKERKTMWKRLHFMEQPEQERASVCLVVEELKKKRHKVEKDSFWGYRIVHGFGSLVEIKYDEARNCITWLKFFHIDPVYYAVPFGDMILWTMLKKIEALGRADATISCNYQQTEFYKNALVIRDVPVDPNSVDEGDRHLPSMIADVHDSLVKLQKTMEQNQQYEITWDSVLKWWRVSDRKS